VSPQDVERDAAQDGKIMCPAILARSGIIFVEDHVEPSATGFLRSAGLRIALDQCGNVKVDTESCHTSIAKVFSCGNVRRGQSLVAWVIRESRQTAHAIDKVPHDQPAAVSAVKNERKTRATKLKH
jgi:thioredoxin reductase